MEERKEPYPLVSSLRGKPDKEGKEIFSPQESRKRQNDKWVALQASDRPSHEVNIDQPPPKPPQNRATITQGTYLKQLNERMDRIIAAQAQGPSGKQMK